MDGVAQGYATTPPAVIGRSSTSWDAGVPGWTWREVLVSLQMLGRRYEEEAKRQRDREREMQDEQETQALHRKFAEMDQGV